MVGAIAMLLPILSIEHKQERRIDDRQYQDTKSIVELSSLTVDGRYVTSKARLQVCKELVTEGAVLQSSKLRSEFCWLGAVIELRLRCHPPECEHRQAKSDQSGPPPAALGAADRHDHTQECSIKAHERQRLEFQVMNALHLAC